MTGAASPPGVVGNSDRLLERIESADGLLAGFDFDGTLAPIRADPDAPTIPDAVQQPLESLAAQQDVSVAIISGRQLEDLVVRAPVEGVDYAGNHGLERQFQGERKVADGAEQYQPLLDDLHSTLRAELAEIPGVRLQDKALTLTVHVRQTPAGRVKDVRETVIERVGDHPALEMSEGKQVFEIRPAVDHDKGTAMRALRERVPDSWLTLYLGDDTTDEDAFEAIQPDAVGIHVGEKTETQARYRIANQAEVADFISWLAETTEP